MKYLEIARRVVNEPGKPEAKTTKPEAAGPILAVKIGGSPVIGDYWFCLSGTEPFDPGDGLPIYRPSEARALAGKGYGPEDLMAVHRAKVILDGTIGSV